MGCKGIFEGKIYICFWLL